MPKVPKPATFEVGRVHVRPHRPRGVRGPHDGRWYWRAVVYEGTEERPAWAGWGTPEEAARLVADLVARDRLDLPRNVAAEVKTVRDLLEVWAAAQEARADTSRFTKRNQITCARHVVATIGAVELRHLDRRALEAHRDRRMGPEDASGETVRKELKILRAAWKWGQEQEPRCVPERSLPSIKITVQPRRNRYTPTPGEVARVLDVLRGWKRLAVLLMYATGARVGEVAALTWADVDLGAGVIALDGKTGARRVPIAGSVCDELAAWRLAREGTSTRPQILAVSPAVVSAHLGSVALPDACERAGVPRFSPHALRRLAVDRLYRSADPGTAAAFLGHSEQTALKHYRQVTMDDLRDALAASNLGEVPRGEVVPLDRARRRN